MVASIQLPAQIWIEIHDSEQELPTSCDVLVKLEDANIYTAHFVTLDYLRHQMELGLAMSQHVEGAPAVRYTTLDTPHVLIEAIRRDIIEDTIDNLLALDIFEGLFTQVTENNADNTASESRTTTPIGTRATQEVAAVVLSDVLVVQGGD